MGDKLEFPRKKLIDAGYRILDIPQCTLSFYEREAEAIPSTLVPAMAKALGVTIEDILKLERPELKKRAPQSQLER